MPSLKPITKAQIVAVEGTVMQYEKIGDGAQPIEKIDLGVEGCNAKGPANLYDIGLTTLACLECVFNPIFGLEGGCKAYNSEGSPPSY